MYTFTDDCITGIDKIDEEHRRLFELLNEIDHELKEPHNDLRLTSMRLMKELKDYASYHFRDEEEYMESIKDEELPRQRRAHQAFISKINSLNLVGASDDQVITITHELLDYMARWLLNHIIGSDTLIGKFQSKYAFTEKYKTGVALIDDEHKKLFDIMENADQAIHDETSYDKYDHIIGILDEMREYTKFHFSDEEHLMEKIAYPDLPAQKKAHEVFVEKLNEVDLDEADEDQEAYLNDLLSFLLKWLSGHILGMDKKIGDFVRNNKIVL